MLARPRGLIVHQRQFGRGYKMSSVYVDLGIAFWLARCESLAECFGLGETGICGSQDRDFVCLDC